MASCSKNILVLLLFLFVAGTNVAKAFTADKDRAALKDDGIRRSHEYPNAEADTHHLGLSVSGYVSLAKFASRSEMQAACSPLVPAVLVQAIHSKQSLQLLKDYLLHIYPSHNFW